MKHHFVRGLHSLTLAAAMVVTVTGCAGGSGGSTAPSAAGTGAAVDEEAVADRQLSTSTAAPALPTMDHSPVISVTSGDGTCVATARTVASDQYAIIVHNNGDQVTEVSVYGAGDKVLAEIRDVGPATEKELDDVALSAGVYEIACKPGGTGTEIRIPLTVTG